MEQRQTSKTVIMSELQYLVNGELVPESEASVSVRDRGFMYGDAAFETLRVYGGTPFEWDRHMDRLQHSCDQLGFGDAVPSGSVLLDQINRMLAANALSDAYVKLSVTRGVQPGKLTPNRNVDPTVVGICSPLPRGGITGERVWDTPATVSLVETTQPPASALPPSAKTHNYLPGILARLELRESNADEALLCSTDGFLTEGATSNLFFVREGVLTTPDVTLPLLPGITREVVLELAVELDIPVETGEYRPDVLTEATELFLTNSTWEIRPVSDCGDHAYDVGPVTRRLQRAFDERVELLYTTA